MTLVFLHHLKCAPESLAIAILPGDNFGLGGSDNFEPYRDLRRHPNMSEPQVCKEYSHLNRSHSID